MWPYQFWCWLRYRNLTLLSPKKKGKQFDSATVRGALHPAGHIRPRRSQDIKHAWAHGACISSLVSSAAGAWLVPWARPPGSYPNRPLMP